MASLQSVSLECPGVTSAGAFSFEEKLLPGFECPRCGEAVHRSHSHGFGEKLVKAATRYRLYRCHECGWRGWLAKETPRRGAVWLRAIGRGVLVLAVIVFVTLLALYLTTY